MRGDAENAAAQPCYMRVNVSGIGARVAIGVRTDLDDLAEVFGIACKTFEEHVEVRQSFFSHIRVELGSANLEPFVSHCTLEDAGFEAVHADVFILVVR